MKKRRAFALLPHEDDLVEVGRGEASQIRTSLKKRNTRRHIQVAPAVPSSGADNCEFRMPPDQEGGPGFENDDENSQFPTGYSGNGGVNHNDQNVIKKDSRMSQTTDSMRKRKNRKKGKLDEACSASEPLIGDRNCEEARVVEENLAGISGGKKKNKRKNKASLDKWGQPIAKEDQAAVAEETLVEDSSISPADIHAEDLQSQEAYYDRKKVCVGGMPYSTTEEDIHSFFAECGSISELDCVTFQDTGKFKGLVFITFKTEAAATRALSLDGANMGGRFLRVEQCRIKRQIPKNERVFKDAPKKNEGCLSAYIGNLAWNVNEVDVKRFFKGCKIKTVRLALDKISGEFRGFGHVDFADDESLEKGIKMDQKDLLGRPLKIAYAVPKVSGAEVLEKGKASHGKDNTCNICGNGDHKAIHCPTHPLVRVNPIKGS